MLQHQCGLFEAPENVEIISKSLPKIMFNGFVNWWRTCIICDALPNLVTFYNLKNQEKHWWRRLQPATSLKVTLLHAWFSRFLNYTNSAKSHKASHIFYIDFYISRNPPVISFQEVQKCPFGNHIYTHICIHPPLTKRCVYFKPPLRYILPVTIDFIDPFHANVSFLYPLKTPENVCFSDVFRGI